LNTKPSAKILVIDDEPAVLRSIVAYLQDSNFTTFGAENGKDGLETYEREHPDLILTDLHMPVIGGLEVLSKINQHSPDTPVIVISGAGELNDAIEALRLGARDYITKPIADMAVLEHSINRALEHRKLIEENKNYAKNIEHNLRVLEQDQAAGRKVQMSLLPQHDLEIQNYQCSYKVIPSLELSGDFVEYFQIDDQHFAVYLADVSGHGASSAFITILLKSQIARYLVEYRAKQSDIILEPAKLMHHVSNEIYHAKLNKYLTLVYGVQNIKTNTFTYGIGGHYPSPILYTTDGNAKFIPGGGFPVGIMTNAEYQQQQITLQSGDFIVMFSDGVLETFMPGANLDQKDQGLIDLVKTSKADLATILRGCGVTTTKTNTSQPDDITILTIKHLPH
jgi:phosphoserine phosphatase RsbU/P